MNGLKRQTLVDWSLDDWLTYIQQQHVRSIDLTLERVAQVWKNLQSTPSNFIIAVAGTNGKGSCVAMLEAVLQETGRKIGSYTSPHLLRYNERIRINGEAVNDATLCRAFVTIEQARNRIPLTYFEFGTLCALLVFAEQQVDASIMEVGMGGRLDAVNLLENNLALITSIGTDHTQWLGNSRISIATEKAGIMKKNALAVCADQHPPPNIARIAAAQNCKLLQSGRDYQVERSADDISWSSCHPAIAPDWQHLTKLKSPLGSAQQFNNLGGVVAALALTQSQTGVTKKNLVDGLGKTKLLGRCQVLPGAPEVILDVAHNRDSAVELAAFLALRKVLGNTHAVFGVLADKAIADIIAAMHSVIDKWYLATLADRGYSADALKEHFAGVGDASSIMCHESPVAAYLSAVVAAKAHDRVVVFGSFHTVGAIIAHIEHPKPETLSGHPRR